MNDNTPEQAKRWVEQEYRTTMTLGDISHRIRAEREILAFIDDHRLGAKLPNSRQAHVDLIAKLEAARLVNRVARKRG